MKPYINSNQVWDIQLGTYKRELERYGINTIAEAESFFYHDSLMIIKIIKNSKDDEIRFLNTLNWIENFILLFEMEDGEILSFLDSLQKQFKEEFKVDKTVRKELSDIYRKLEEPLFKVVKLKKTNSVNLYKIVGKFLMLKKKGSLQVSLEHVLASFIHMSINKCFRSKQRLYEMVVYDFLYRKYKSKFMRYGKL